MDFVCCIYDKTVNLFIFIWDILTYKDMKVVELVLTAVGCSIAYKALSTWREQVIETPKINLAREIMESFYTVVDIIKDIRRNFRETCTDEIRKYFKMENLTEAQCTCLEPYYEIQQNMDIFLQFQKLKNKAKVNYGNVLDESFHDIIDIINEIKTASRNLYKDCDKEYNAYDIIQENRNIIYQSKDDDINKKLDKAIKTAEKHLKPLYNAKCYKEPNK